MNDTSLQIVIKCSTNLECDLFLSYLINSIIHGHSFKVLYVSHRKSQLPSSIFAMTAYFLVTSVPPSAPLLKDEGILGNPVYLVAVDAASSYVTIGGLPSLKLKRKQTSVSLQKDEGGLANPV